MSVCPASEDAELQMFENQLVSTGLYPGDLSEEVVQQYGGQPEVPGIHPSDPDNERVVHMVNIARAVGVEVAQANHVLVKEMLDRQGKLTLFLNFAIGGNGIFHLYGSGCVTRFSHFLGVPHVVDALFYDKHLF